MSTNHEMSLDAIVEVLNEGDKPIEFQHNGQFYTLKGGTSKWTFEIAERLARKFKPVSWRVLHPNEQGDIKDEIRALADEFVTAQFEAVQAEIKAEKAVDVEPAEEVVEDVDEVTDAVAETEAITASPDSGQPSSETDEDA